MNNFVSANSIVIRITMLVIIEDGLVAIRENFGYKE